MPSVTMHPERVKAEIRLRHGSLVAFAALHRLEAQAVRDCLRGTSNTAKPHVAELLGIEPDQLVISRTPVVEETNSKPDDASHRLSAEAR